MGLTAKKKNQPKTTQIPRQLLNMILQRIGGAAYPTLIENGPANDSSSTTSAIEASLSRNFDKSIALSVQQLLDCDVEYDRGCSGGNPINAYRYIMTKGLTTAASYPFYSSNQKVSKHIYTGK